MDEFKFDFSSYRDNSINHYHDLLENNPTDEKCFQKFFERNLSFIPGAHSAFGQSMSGHDPIHDCLISQPKIRGLNTRIPDFMWLSYDSSVFSPVLIEIEAPSKKLFNKDGSPTSDFTKAKNQLDEWAAHLSKPENQLNFFEDFDIDQDTRRLHFEPFYILIYGRRSEFDGNEILTRKRRTLVDKSTQQILMSFDRLCPNEIDVRFSCCYMRERQLNLIALGQKVKLDGSADYLTNLQNLQNGIDEMMFTSDERTDYLKANINEHIKVLKEEKNCR